MLAHLVLLLMLAGVVVLPAIVAPVPPTLYPPTAVPDTAGPVKISLPAPLEEPVGPAGPPLPDADASTLLLEPSGGESALPDVISTRSPGGLSIRFERPKSEFQAEKPRLATRDSALRRDELRKLREIGAAKALDKWFPRRELPRPGAAIEAEFPLYWAKYENADWRTTLTIRNGEMVGGPLHNLAEEARRRSKGNLAPQVAPQPLDLASEDLLREFPPFVYLTGHKDFRLTDAEVENVRAYLMQGGVLWADNGLAGEGSRFDVAFRRELRRVFPDDDLQLAPLPAAHAVYRGGPYRFASPPSGMQRHAAPVEALLIDGFVAVICTPNNYTDLMRMVWQPGATAPDLQEGPGKVRVTPAELWQHRETFYRNFEPEAAEQAYRFGLNVLHHLLSRWGDDGMRL